MSIQEHFIEAKEVLEAFISNPENFESIEKAGQLLVNSIQSDGKIISCGNGGSLCDAMHFAEEFTGRFRKNRRALPVISLTDSSHVTCVANDFGFDEVFSRGVEVESFGILSWGVVLERGPWLSKMNPNSTNKVIFYTSISKLNQGPLSKTTPQERIPKLSTSTPREKTSSNPKSFATHVT
jgi:hypothetical protein